MHRLPQEALFKDAGVPIPDGFDGSRKSVTLPPSNENRSAIGVLFFGDIIAL